MIQQRRPYLLAPPVRRLGPHHPKIRRGSATCLCTRVALLTSARLLCFLQKLLPLPRFSAARPRSGDGLALFSVGTSGTMNKSQKPTPPPPKYMFYLRSKTFFFCSTAAVQSLLQQHTKHNMSSVKDGGRNDRLSWSKRAEHVRCRTCCFFSESLHVRCNSLRLCRRCTSDIATPCQCRLPSSFAIHA